MPKVIRDYKDITITGIYKTGFTQYKSYEKPEILHEDLKNAVCTIYTGRSVCTSYSGEFKYTFVPVTCVHARCGTDTSVHRLIEYLHEKDLICARRTSRVSARFASAL